MRSPTLSPMTLSHWSGGFGPEDGVGTLLQCEQKKKKRGLPRENPKPGLSVQNVQTDCQSESCHFIGGWCSKLRHKRSKRKEYWINISRDVNKHKYTNYCILTSIDVCKNFSDVERQITPISPCHLSPIRFLFLHRFPLFPPSIPHLFFQYRCS